MMQSTDLWNLDHRTERGRLGGSADRRIFFERQMRAASFVVIEIAIQDPAQSGAMANNDVIQAFAPNGTDQALRVGVLPRALGRRQDFVNAHPIRQVTELLSINAVAVAQQVPGGVIPREGFQKLTSCPFCRAK